MGLRPSPVKGCAQGAFAQRNSSVSAGSAWIARRSITRDAGAVAFGHASLLTPILIAFIAVSAIEIPVVHLLMPWETIRRVFLGLGLWGVIWMIGLLASLRIYPHEVGEKGLRVRYGFNLDVTLPWDVIAGSGRTAVLCHPVARCSSSASVSPPRSTSRYGARRMSRSRCGNRHPCACQRRTRRNHRAPFLRRRAKCTRVRRTGIPCSQPSDGNDAA